MEMGRTAGQSELRGRCEIIVEPKVGVATPVVAARIVAQEWKRRALDLASTPTSDALSCVLAALDGEIDPARLGVEQGGEAWRRLQALRRGDRDVWEVELEPTRSGMWSCLLLRNGQAIAAPVVNLTPELAITTARARAQNIVGREGAAERIRLEVEE